MVGMHPEHWPGPPRSTETAPAATNRMMLLVRQPAHSVTARRPHKRLGRGTSVHSVMIRTRHPATGGDGASSAMADRPRPSGAGAPRIRTVRSATSRMALAHPHADPATAVFRARTRSGGTPSAASATTLTPVDPSPVQTVSGATETSATIFRTPPTAPVATRSGESQGVGAGAGAVPAARDRAAECAVERQEG